MSADGSIRLLQRTIQWGDDDYTFRLGIGELRELQDNVNRFRASIGAAYIGPRTLCKILEAGDAWLDEVREPIRLGLIGYGMEPAKALVLVRRYVDARPLAESMPIAHAIVATALIGVPDDPVGKKPMAGETNQATTASSSPRSTVPVLPLDGTQEPLTPPLSGNLQQPLTDGLQPMAESQA